jgi:hypothetical protein
MSVGLSFSANIISVILPKRKKLKKDSIYGKKEKT